MSVAPSVAVGFDPFLSTDLFPLESSFNTVEDKLEWTKSPELNLTELDFELLIMATFGNSGSLSPPIDPATVLSPTTITSLQTHTDVPRLETASPPLQEPSLLPLITSNNVALATPNYMHVPYPTIIPYSSISPYYPISFEWGGALPTPPLSSTVLSPTIVSMPTMPPKSTLPFKLSMPMHLLPLDVPIQQKRKSTAEQIEQEDTNITIKRVRNTLSARRSRAKRAAKMDFLEERVISLEKDNERLRRELAAFKFQFDLPI